MSDNHNTVFRPLVGGIAIRNATLGQKGTLGLIATSDGLDRWLVSCYHVLCRNGGTMPANVTEDIVQPRSTVVRPVVAQVNDQRAQQQLDAAAALVLSPPGALGRILGIARLSQPVAPVIGMRVLKSGAETGVTEGVVRRIQGEDVEIEPLWPDHIICQPGDSGAVWVDANSLAPVVLNCEERNPGRKSFGRRLVTVLSQLGLQMVVD